MNNARDVLLFTFATGFFGLAVVVVVGYLSWRFRKQP